MTREAPRRPLGVTVALWVVLGMLVAHVLHGISGLGGASIDSFFNDWVYNAVLITAVAICLTRALLVPQERLAWLAIATGFGSWAIGDLYWTIHLSDLDQIPYPSIADAFYVGHVSRPLCRDHVARSRPGAALPSERVARRGDRCARDRGCGFGRPLPGNQERHRWGRGRCRHESRLSARRSSPAVDRGMRDGSHRLASWTCMDRDRRWSPCTRAGRRDLSLSRSKGNLRRGRRYRFLLAARGHSRRLRFLVLSEKTTGDRARRAPPDRCAVTIWVGCPRFAGSRRPCGHDQSGRARTVRGHALRRASAHDALLP